MRKTIIVGLAITLVTLPACELAEISIPPSDPIVVVQAVMRPDLPQQWIIVEQTLTGRVSNDNNGSVIPGSDQPLQAPIANAIVRVSNLTLPGDPCGTSVEFTESPPPGRNRQAGVYWGPPNCPTMRAGDTLEVHIEALDSVVTGRTEIPGITRASLETRSAIVTAAGAQLTFNRDIDTLTASVNPTHGRALHVELFQNSRVFADTARDVSSANAWFWVDSTRMTLPGDLINLFEVDADISGGNTPDLFMPGFSYTITTAFMDQNLFDSYRSANFPLSGRGFINRISGGYGFFASLVSQTNQLRVIGNVDDPREGSYQLAGVVSGVGVGFEAELYVGRQWIPGDSTDPAGAFLTGNWVDGPIDRSARGWFRGSNLELYVEAPRPSGGVGVWVVTGFLQAGNTLSVFDLDGRNLGALSVERR